MKVLFVGPSLHGQSAELEARYPDLDLRGPACRGDIATAVFEGAEAIGLIDGCFGDMPSVWHKEILHALECRVPIGGGASMGALRAAECFSLGMVGIGSIFAEYASGAIVDDEAVAVAHAPAELNWMPLSVPWVDFEATVGNACDSGGITPAEKRLLMLAGKQLHYTQRTLKAATALCSDIGADRRAAILRELSNAPVDRKRKDAWEVANWLHHVETPLALPAWKLARTSHWLALADSVGRMPSTATDATSSLQGPPSHG